MRGTETRSAPPNPSSKGKMFGLHYPKTTDCMGMRDNGEQKPQKPPSHCSPVMAHSLWKSQRVTTRRDSRELWAKGRKALSQPRLGKTLGKTLGRMPRPVQRKLRNLSPTQKMHPRGTFLCHRSIPPIFGDVIGTNFTQTAITLVLHGRWHKRRV